jgi:hypothetical protein
MKIFLSYSFRYGHDLTRAVDRLISSQEGTPPITGRNLAGQPVDAAVQDKIIQSDALISLVLKNPNQQPGEAPWSQAVNQEYDFAKNRHMRSIAVVEDGLAFQGMSPKEYIPYNPANPTESILRISETITEWRRAIGQEMRVQILPKALADKLDNNTALKCSHRYWDKDISTPWKEVQHISEDEGTFIWLRGVSPFHKVELRVMDQQKVVWQMKARVPWPMLQLKEAKNG